MTALVRVVAVGVVAGALLGCESGDDQRTAACDSPDPASYRVKGVALAGDLDGDTRADRVTLRRDAARPPGCRHLLVAEVAGDQITAPVPPLPWPGGDPQLLLLAEIDGRAGVEPVVALAPANVYRPGTVFTFRDGTLSQLRRQGAPVTGHFPFYDEFAAGVDCVGRPGSIVVTQGRISDRGDRFWEIGRTFYRADGFRFVPLRTERFEVDVGDEAQARWPEVRGEPFLSCPGRVR